MRPSRRCAIATIRMFQSVPLTPVLCWLPHVQHVPSGYSRCSSAASFQSSWMNLAWLRSVVDAELAGCSGGVTDATGSAPVAPDPAQRQCVNQPLQCSLRRAVVLEPELDRHLLAAALTGYVACIHR